MAYANKDLYSSRHEVLIEALKSGGFPSEGDWLKVVFKSRQLVTTEGYDVDRYDVCQTLRKHAEADKRKKGGSAAAPVAEFLRPLVKQAS